MIARSVAVLLAAFVLAAPTCAQTGGADASITAALELFQYRLVQTGMRVRGYPPQALRAKQTGTAVVAMRVAADGSLSGHRLVQSTGHAVLDDHAIVLLAQAVPLTEIPAALQNRAFVVRVAIAFVLSSQD